MYNFAIADPSSIGGTAIRVCDESSAEMAMTGLAGKFAGEGKVRTVCTEDRLDNINTVLDRMRQGQIEGRVVMRIADAQ